MAANGLTLLRLDQVQPQVQIQDKLLKEGPAVKQVMAKLGLGKAKAFSFRLGEISKAYIYLQEDDTRYSQVSLTYKMKGKKKVTLHDKAYPFEFTLDLPAGQNALQLQLKATRRNRKKEKSPVTRLGSD